MEYFQISIQFSQFNLLMYKKNKVFEKILNSRIFRNKLQLLVQWKGYGPEDNYLKLQEDVHAPGKRIVL